MKGGKGREDEEGLLECEGGDGAGRVGVRTERSLEGEGGEGGRTVFEYV